MTHDEIKAELSSYALGALDAAERRTVQDHLAEGCQECSHDLATWREIVGSLALAGTEQQAPDLKNRLLEKVGTRRRGAVLPFSRRIALPLALAAGALLALSVGRVASWRREAADSRALVTRMQSQLADAGDRLQRLTETLAAKEHDVSTLRTALAAANEALEVVQQPGLRMVHLKETPDARPAEAHVLLSPDTRRALFYAFDLPQVPADKAYELWWITEKQGPVMAAVFTPDQRGLGRVKTALPADTGAIQAAAVTIEPNGGVPKPTGPMVLVGKL